MQPRSTLGRAHGGFSTEPHVRCDRRGHPFACGLTPGQAADHPAFVPLLAAPAVRGARPGLRPERLVADRDYSNAPVCHHLLRRGIGAVVALSSCQRQTALIDWDAYRTYGVLEH